MSDNKLGKSELRRALAARAGSKEQEAKRFLDALNEQIIEGLKQDRQVKVNGIGTFRLQNMAPRESMNVNTGERITIKGYEKIVFSPEAGVKELIEHNTPMKKKNAKTVTDETNPLEKLGAQADEIVGILADLGQSPEEEEKPKKNRRRKEAAAKAVEPQAETVELKAEKPKARKQSAAKQAEQAEQAEAVKPAEPETAAPAEQPQSQEAPEAPQAPETPEAPEAPKSEEKKKKNHFLRDTLICVVILLLLLLIGYFFLRHQIGNWLDSLRNPQPVQTEVVVVAEEPATAVEADAPAVAEEIVYDKLITTERMHRHSRLAWMAFRYYGDKQFWVYLYDANKDHIVNPDKIVTGTPIRVPQLTQEQMDTTLASTRATLQRLLEQGEEAKRK